MTRPFSHMAMTAKPEDYTAILWAINRFIFHPRGFALAFVYEDGAVGPGSGSEPSGWMLLGAGKSEVWSFSPEQDDDGFLKFEAFLESARTAVMD